MKQLLVILLLILPLQACSFFKTKNVGADLLLDTDLGPDTKDLLKTIPKGFPADTQNARHTDSNLKADDRDNGSIE